MKRAGIFNPYWDTLGGGERYTATVAKALERAGFTVSVYWTDDQLIKKINNRFSINLKNTTIDRNGHEVLTKGSFIQKISLEQKLDCLFWVSDGSLPFMCSKKNLLHFQVPFNRPQTSLPNKLKMITIDHVICNSHFTQNIIDTNYGCHSTVIYPPVLPIKSDRKQRIILSVGRFDNLLHAKRQDVLIDAFCAMKLSGWKLVLAGGSLDHNPYLDKLNKKIATAAIEIVTNPDYQTLIKWYQQATLYWHAAGYGADLITHPEHAEHFGITTVEAMSAGAVPLVFAGGGQTEIVHPGENGLLWTTKTELINQTKSLTSDTVWLSKLRQESEKTAIQFSEARFINEFITLFR